MTGTTISKLLRDADPLAHEPRRSDVERRASRERVLATPADRADGARPTRRMALAAATTLAAAVVAGGYWFRSVEVAAAVRFEVRLAEENPGSGLTAAAAGNRTIYLHPDTVVTNAEILRAQVMPGSSPSAFGVAITFTEAGAAKMSRASTGHVGRPMAILIDGKVVMTPTVRDPITSSAVISGDFTRAEAARIVDGVIGR